MHRPTGWSVATSRKLPRHHLAVTPQTRRPRLQSILPVPAPSDCLACSSSCLSFLDTQYSFNGIELQRICWFPVSYAAALTKSRSRKALPWPTPQQIRRRPRSPMSSRSLRCMYITTSDVLSILTKHAVRYLQRSSRKTSFAPFATN